LGKELEVLTNSFGNQQGASLKEKQQKTGNLIIKLTLKNQH
jgi:hypothetical protein